MSNILNHAYREFKAAGWLKDEKYTDDMQQLMCEQVIELLKLFSSHGHSGFSANYAINLFTKLAKFEPIVPLTGEDSEWNEVGDGMWQNNRCSHVFKDSSGYTYDIQGKVFTDSNGCSYTSKDSHTKVVFPYTPKTIYVKVED